MTTEMITVLGTLLSNAINLAHELLIRKQPEMAKKLLEHSLKKVSIVSRIKEIHAMQPQDRNCAELENLYAKDVENDQQIAIYQTAAYNEAVRLNTSN